MDNADWLPVALIQAEECRKGARVKLTLLTSETYIQRKELVMLNPR